MIAEARTWVDVEYAVRAWAQAELPALGQGRIGFGINKDAPLPQIVILQIAGTDDRAWIQFDVWGSKPQAAQTASQLETAVDALSRYVYQDSIILHGGLIQNRRWLIDVESNTSRYVIDTTFTTTAAA